MSPPETMPNILPAPTRHVTPIEVIAVRGGEAVPRTDRLVGEEPMEIRVAGPGQNAVSVAVTMRTPGHEDELAVGFLHSEGLIEGQEVVEVTFGDSPDVAQPDDIVTVHLSRPFDPSVVAARQFAATASCGICGKATLDEIEVRCDVLPPGPIVRLDVVLALPDRLRAGQDVFEATGGLHAVGLFEPDDTLISIREDVGRHNALDKLVGQMVLAGRTPLHGSVLMVSGRVSFEIVQKAAVAGIPIVAAISAPSDLAVEAARRLGMTLIGFLRGDGFNVYSHPERVDLEANDHT